MTIEVDGALTDRVMTAWLSPLGYSFMSVCGLLFLVWLFRYRKQKPLEEIDFSIFKVMFVLSAVFDLTLLLLHLGTYAFNFWSYPLTTWHVFLFSAAVSGVFCVFINVISRFYYQKTVMNIAAGGGPAAEFQVVKAADKKWVVWAMKSLIFYFLILMIYYVAKLFLGHVPATDEEKKIFYVIYLKLATTTGIIFGAWNLKSIYLILNKKDDLSRHPALAGHAK